MNFAKPAMRYEALSALQQGDNVDVSFFDDETAGALEKANAIIANLEASPEEQNAARAFITQCEGALSYAQARAERENPSYSPLKDIALCREEIQQLVERSGEMEHGNGRKTVKLN